MDPLKEDSDPLKIQERLQSRTHVRDIENRGMESE